MENLNKAIPLPSLDDIILIAARTLHQNSKNFTYNECEKLAKEQYNIVLQNGVETYKEEPELTVSGKQRCMVG